MDNQHVFPAPPNTTPDKPTQKLTEGQKVLIGFGVIVFLFAVGGISYFFGRQSGSSSEAPTPTTSPISTPSVLDLQAPTGPPIATLAPTKIPTPESNKETTTVTLSSNSELDGFQSSNKGGSSGVDVRAGRNQLLVTRGFVSFDLSSIPDGATISHATLRLYQVKTIGDPYGVGGNLRVDHLNYGDSLESEDYAAPALISNLATLSFDADSGWKETIVTQAVKTDMEEGRGMSQFRVHFDTENSGGDLTGDFTYFESADDSEGTGNTPQLVVKYQ